MAERSGGVVMRRVALTSHMVVRNSQVPSAFRSVAFHARRTERSSLFRTRPSALIVIREIVTVDATVPLTSMSFAVRVFASAVRRGERDARRVGRPSIVSRS